MKYLPSNPHIWHCCPATYWLLGNAGKICLVLYHQFGPKAFYHLVCLPIVVFLSDLQLVGGFIYVIKKAQWYTTT